MGHSIHIGTKSSATLFNFLAQATGDQCDLPQVIGTGPYRIPRWYYNPNTQKCNLFYYSGCCGNGNNFQSLQSCQVLCEGEFKFIRLNIAYNEASKQ